MVRMAFLSVGAFALATGWLAAACGDTKAKVYTCKHADDVQSPPCNPYLADSTWPLCHQSPYAQASCTVAGPPPGEPLEVDTLTTDFVSITLAFSGPYPDGGRVIWGSSAAAVFKVDPSGTELQMIDSVAKEMGLDNLIAGAYTLVDADGRFYVPEKDVIDVYADEHSGVRNSPIVKIQTFSLPDAGPDEAIIGLNMTWDGRLAFATTHARIAVLSRDFDDLHMATLAADETVSNSIAVDETGGIFVVTSKHLYRVQWTGSALSTDPSDGAWSATYEHGPLEPVVGRLGMGSGSTPSLMGTSEGQDRLVVITDGRQLMHLVFFWRDTIPEGWTPVRPDADVRVAAEVPVTYGSADATSSFSEQSVLVSGYRAVVVNNDYGPVQSQLEPIFEGIAPPGVEQFEWDPQTRTARSVWAVPDVSCPNGIPGMSRGSGLMYCIGKRADEWTLEGFDWQTGQVVLTEVLGSNIRFNSAYAGAEIGPDGAFYSGTFTGLVRVRVAGQ